MRQYIVDAFADRVFEGNPAAVCVLDRWPEEDRMMRITRENNLSETAFAVPEGEGYRGYPTHSDEEVCAFVRRAMEERMQLLAHCNGDAACGQYIGAFRKAVSMGDGVLPADIRPVMIHAQLLGLDQIPKVKAMGMIPSFFAGHVYHWGDIHADNFGMGAGVPYKPGGFRSEGRHCLHISPGFPCDRARYVRDRVVCGKPVYKERKNTWQ